MPNNHHEHNKIFIGIDVSKATLDIHIHPQATNFTIKNDAKSIVEWIKSSAPKYATIIFEATGGYERILLKILTKHPNLLAKRIHPSQVKSFARAFGKQAKTDAIDAEMLAKAGIFLGNLLHDTTPENEIQELRDLLARKAQLQAMLHAEQCRVKLESLNKAVVADLKSNINALKKRIFSIESAASALIAQNNYLQKRADRLQKVVGIGAQVAMTVLAFLPEIGKVDRKKIASIAGLAPITNQSGKSLGKARVQGGRQMLKKALYMATLVGIQYNHVLKTFYQSLLEKRKPKMVAIIATARKLLLHINAIEKNAQFE